METECNKHGKRIMESVGMKEDKEKKYGKYEDYEIESAARTLAEAEEIKADPDKMKYVKMCLKKDKEAAVKAYKSLDDIREEAKNMPDEDDDY